MAGVSNDTNMIIANHLIPGIPQIAGVYESIIGDWDYNPELNRSIHVSSAYMLWVMEHVDNAQNLIKEMKIVR